MTAKVDIFFQFHATIIHFFLHISKFNSNFDSAMKRLLLYSALLLLPLFVSAETFTLEQRRERSFQAPVLCDGDTVMMTFLRNKSVPLDHACVGAGIPNETAVDPATKGRLVIPDSVTAPNGIRCKVDKIARRAFAGCKNLTEVVMPETITDIGDQAFIGCKSMTRLTLPRDLRVIWPCAFRECPSLRVVILHGQEKFSLYNDIFDHSTMEHAILMIPAGKVEEFRNSLVWGVFQYWMENHDL